MAELVDALVSGTSGESRGGSSPLLGTNSRAFSCHCGNLLNLQSPRCAVHTQDQYTDGFSIQYDVEAGRKVRGVQGPHPASRGCAARISGPVRASVGGEIPQRCRHPAGQGKGRACRGQRRSKGASRRSGAATATAASILHNARPMPWRAIGIVGMSSSTRTIPAVPMGTTLYAMICGALPWRRATPRPMKPSSMLQRC
jgi:hypothetical protein